MQQFRSDEETVPQSLPDTTFPEHQDYREHPARNRARNEYRKPARRAYDRAYGGHQLHVSRAHGAQTIENKVAPKTQESSDQ
jgi:hypothetical protein